MVNPENQNQTARRDKKIHIPSPARKIGYIVVIIILIVILYLIRNYERWNLTFLTEEFSKCLFYIELSIYINIGANILFIFYDNKWFKHLLQAVTDVAGALSLIMIYVIYPLNISNGDYDNWIKTGLLIIFVLTVISILINLIKGIRYLVQEPEAV
ncbi:MAG: hypothetical protein KBC43_05460 [Bacteroidales bacterium]|nr:hypothetical protein [Bacteroidales bacterium]